MQEILGRRWKKKSQSEDAMTFFERRIDLATFIANSRAIDMFVIVNEEHPLVVAILFSAHVVLTPR